MHTRQPWAPEQVRQPSQRGTWDPPGGGGSPEVAGPSVTLGLPLRDAPSRQRPAVLGAGSRSLPVLFQVPR